MAEELELECKICSSELIDCPADPVQALQCMHAFHLYCIGEVAKHGSGSAKDYVLTCPECREVQGANVLKQILEDATQLEIATATTDIEIGTTEVAEQAPDEPEAPDEPAALDEPDALDAPEAPEGDAPAATADEDDAPLVPRKTTAADGEEQAPGPKKKRKRKKAPAATGEANAAPQSKTAKAKTAKAKTAKATAKARPAATPAATATPAALPHVGPVCEELGRRQLPRPTLTCSDCGCEALPDQCRLTSKTKQTFRCTGCRTKVAF